MTHWKIKKRPIKITHINSNVHSDLKKKMKSRYKNHIWSQFNKSYRKTAVYDRCPSLIFICIDSATPNFCKQFLKMKMSTAFVWQISSEDKPYSLINNSHATNVDATKLTQLQTFHDYIFYITMKIFFSMEWNCFVRTYQWYWRVW